MIWHRHISQIHLHTHIVTVILYVILVLDICVYKCTLLCLDCKSPILEPLEMLVLMLGTRTSLRLAAWLYHSGIKYVAPEASPRDQRIGPMPLSSSSRMEIPPSLPKSATFSAYGDDIRDYIYIYISRPMNQHIDKQTTMVQECSRIYM